MSLRSLAAAVPVCALLGVAPLAAVAQHARPDPSIQGDVSMCTGCHGIPGYKTAYPKVYHVPKIGGQNPAYIANALKAYRSGARYHPSMRGIAAGLSDADIEKLAAYYGEAAK
ncbi:MAG TPA: c-type cytochrome [Burkholderiales bacterium]|nr:c-type cytochrome [Burkholderiales bacterium]